MQYKPSIVSPPILVSETKEIAIGGLGDTLNISLDVVYDTELHLEAKDPIPLTPKPSVRLSMKYKSIIDVITRGESFDITVELSEPLTYDISVDYIITEDRIGNWQDIRVIKEINNTPDNFNYDTLLNELSNTELDKTSGTITITAGNLSSSDTITSSINTELFYGKGSYFCSKVEISNVIGGDVLVNPINTAYVLYEDAIDYPKWGNFEIELWGKLPILSYYQPVYDPQTEDTVKWTFGYEEVSLLEDPLLRTKIIDDTPLDYIQLRVSDNTLTPLDLENTESPINLVNRLPFYKCVITAGRRN